MSPTVLKKKNAGFTLLELLIAISIFAVLATIVYSSLNAVLSKNNAIKGGVAVFEMAKNCLSRMSQDLTSIYVTQYPEYETPNMENPPDPYRIVGEQEFSGAANFPKLRFASTAHLPISTDATAGLAEIRYYVEKTEDSDDGYVLKRGDTPFPYDIDVDGYLEDRNDPILCEGIESLDFTYYDAEGNTHETWDSDSPSQKYATPRAVMISLTVKTKNGSHSFSTRVDIPVFREGLENVRQ